MRVNAIAPGTITMPGDPPEWEQDFIKRAPLRKSSTIASRSELNARLNTADCRLVAAGSALLISGSIIVVLVRRAGRQLDVAQKDCLYHDALRT